jgi:CRISPR-associated endonuclease Csn1
MEGEMRFPYRLGIDIGTNSIGWCVLDLDKSGHPRGVRRMGVRIFSDGRDPQSGTSLAAERRLPRGQRRRRDRYLDRRADLMAALVRHGLMSADKAERKKLEDLDPYELRAKGLDEGLPLHHFGRAIFHLNQRRGFKSNRKTDKPADPDKAKETAGMKDAIGILEREIADSGCRTLGSYLYATARKGRSVRGSKDGTVQPMLTVRARPHAAKGGRNAYDFYPSRAMYEQEFDALWAAQAARHPELAAAARDEIRDILFFQRPLKPVDPGKCALDATDKRAPLALPIVQQFRILQELANLRLEDPLGQTVRRLTLHERDKLFAELRTKEKVPFGGTQKKPGLRKLLDLDSRWKINLEDQRRPELRGDGVSKRLADPTCFGAGWHDLPESRQTEIVSALLDEPEESKVVARAMAEWGLGEAQARAVSAVPLTDGYGRVGLKALRKIVPIMLSESDAEGGLLHYSEAAERAGYDHSDCRTGEIFDQMPYYGEVLSNYVAEIKSPNASADEKAHGRIANPTVHIGLNQLRKLVNALIREYGKPDEVVVELARDLKLNAEEKERIKKEQTENKRKNDARREKLAELGMLNRSDGILRLRLWEELGDNPADRRCLYTGEQISVQRLFSDAVEIEHILPFQDMLDDSPANLTVSMRYANRAKGKRSPHAAFHDSPEIAGHRYDWDAIVKRAASLPANKRWRFKDDAVELVRNRSLRDLTRSKGLLPKEALDDIERSGAFLGRHLIDTAYLARVARQYLWTACENPDDVWVIPGRLTEFIRRKWGLNKLLYGNRPDPDDGAAPGQAPKRRDDHRHHAIDAFVVGLTDRSLLQRVSTAAGRAEERTIEDMPEPWDRFRDDLKAWLDRMVISFKPEHGTQGRLHEDTAYGIVKHPEKEGGATLVYRKALDSLNANEIERIRDKALRQKLKDSLGALLFDGTLLDAANETLKQAKRGRDPAAIAEATANVKKLKDLKKSQKKSAAKDLKTALAAFGREYGIRHVRLLKTEASFVAIENQDCHPYKAVSAGDNQRVEIYARPDGTWGAEVVTVFNANQRDYEPHWRREIAGARHVATYHKDDLVRLQVDGSDRTMRVASIWEKYLQLAGHVDTNLAERYRSGEFKWTFANYEKLREQGVRKVTVDVLGRVHDPGPPA